MAAMRAHATQITLDGPFFALSNNLGNAIWGIEHYRLVKGDGRARARERPRDRPFRRRGLIPATVRRATRLGAGLLSRRGNSQ